MPSYTTSRPNYGFSFIDSVVDYAWSVTNVISEEVAQLRQDIGSDLQCLYTDDDREFFHGADKDRNTIQADFLIHQERKRTHSELSDDSCDDFEDMEISIPGMVPLSKERTPPFNIPSFGAGGIPSMAFERSPKRAKMEPDTVSPTRRMRNQQEQQRCRRHGK